ncbi:MAG TPA: hypothetical protein VGA50_02775 [Kiloniellales bacterium]
MDAKPAVVPSDEPVDLFFTYWTHADMADQDVHLPCPDQPGMVCRVQPKDVATRRDEELYSTADMHLHDPLNPAAVGPYEPGQPLGITLGDWLLAAGTARLSCDESGKGKVRARFENLVPNATYTMWYAWVARPVVPGGFLYADNPIGAENGSENVFRTDDKGNAAFEATHTQCFALSNEHTWVVLAVAYHSDGKTYGPWVGPAGQGAHVQIFQMLPTEEELTR